MMIHNVGKNVNLLMEYTLKILLEQSANPSVLHRLLQHM